MAMVYKALFGESSEHPWTNNSKGGIYPTPGIGLII